MKRVEILLVEDNPGNIDLAGEAMEKSKILNHLHVARDGEEAMSFLKKEGEFSKVPRPELIILDLNDPGFLAFHYS